jgi:hypothetical protein
MVPQFLSSEFKLHLEEVEGAGKPVEIKFRADNGGLITIKGKIWELSTSDNNGYLRTDNGARIQLDKLVEVDGVPVSYMA